MRNKPTAFSYEPLAQNGIFMLRIIFAAMYQ
jgi:hypothetical protein